MNLIERIFDVTIVMVTIRMATPLIIAGIGGMFSERSGVINIALEGKMLFGAFSSVAISYYTGNPWLGVAGAILIGGLIGFLHAVVSIKFNANQVVSGVAINILAIGLTAFLLETFFHVSGTTPTVARLPVWGGFSPIVYFVAVLVVFSHITLFHTPFGLRLIAAGEHPKALETAGVNVIKIRYLGVIISGCLAGLAGAQLSIGTMSLFVEGMTAGRGFIALAALIFGKWTPLGTLGACLLFGFTDALGMRLAGLGIGLPTQFIQMLPFVVTMIALVSFVGRARPPKAIGMSYQKE